MPVKKTTLNFVDQLLWRPLLY